MRLRRPQELFCLCVVIAVALFFSPASLLLSPRYRNRSNTCYLGLPQIRRTKLCIDQGRREDIIVCSSEHTFVFLSREGVGSSLSGLLCQYKTPWNISIALCIHTCIQHTFALCFGRQCVLSALPISQHSSHNARGEQVFGSVSVLLRLSLCKSARESVLSLPVFLDAFWNRSKGSSTQLVVLSTNQFSSAYFFWLGFLCDTTNRSSCFFLIFFFFFFLL